MVELWFRYWFMLMWIKPIWYIDLDEEINYNMRSNNHITKWFRNSILNNRRWSFQGDPFIKKTNISLWYIVSSILSWSIHIFLHFLCLSCIILRSMFFFFLIFLWTCTLQFFSSVSYTNLGRPTLSNFFFLFSIHFTSSTLLSLIIMLIQWIPSVERKFPSSLLSSLSWREINLL